MHEIAASRSSIADADCGMDMKSIHTYAPAKEVSDDAFGWIEPWPIHVCTCVDMSSLPAQPRSSSALSSVNF